MNLTVKARIILGFVAISVLLIIISLVSLVNLRSVQKDIGEVNTVAVPTVIGSNSLKASFLNMGRLAFESYVSKHIETVENKQVQFNHASDEFSSAYNNLAKTVVNDEKLSVAVKNVHGFSQEYLSTIKSFFNSHNEYLSRQEDIETRLMDLEDNADDASTYLVDFSDLDSVSSNPKLRRASDLGGELENRLLTLITATSDYIKTDTLVRADTLGNELQFAVNKAQEQIDILMDTTDGEDDSGTLDEVEMLVSDALDAVIGSDGVMALHVQRLELRNSAERSLATSEELSGKSIDELEKLLALTNAKVKSVEEEVTSNVSSSTTMVMGIAAVSIVIAFFTAMKTVNAISIPLSQVNQLLKVASSGDLTHMLDDSKQDEFGMLAKNCNRLITNLKELIQGINVRAEQLAAASEQTSAVTTLTTNSIQDQKSHISQVAAATTHMHSTSQLVTQNAEDTLEEIRHADDESKKVRTISLENKETIEVLAKDVDEAASVINKLHQDSASIGSILDVIRGIADQTNLLALNAAIEAARAGEQGRGFAVVADEVRTLASRTQESTQEINSMIEVLQEGAERAVAVMDQGKVQTAVCVTKTEQATEALDVISEAVRRAHDVSSQIEQSAQEQNIVSQEISQKLENIVGIAEETTTGAQQTSESSLEVARLADELQNSIRQFKV